MVSRHNNKNRKTLIFKKKKKGKCIVLFLINYWNTNICEYNFYGPFIGKREYYKKENGITESIGGYKFLSLVNKCLYFFFRLN